MTFGTLALAAGAGATLAGGGGFAAWRWWWFWRDPPRTIPAGDNLVSPADGTVAYVRRVAPDDPVVSIKKGLAASINDIVREDLAAPKILIGIFMGPFDVHVNRAPMTGVVESTVQHPAIGRNRFMGSMLVRSWLRRRPLHTRSPHIVSNNRAVTRFTGSIADVPAWCYVVQIGSFGASGIDVHVQPGATVAKGEVFGMIRLGSQVDLVVPARADFEIAVKEGQRVKAGETVVVRVRRVCH